MDWDIVLSECRGAEKSDKTPVCSRCRPPHSKAASIVGISLNPKAESHLDRRRPLFALHCPCSIFRSSFMRCPRSQLFRELLYRDHGYGITDLEYISGLSIRFTPFGTARNSSIEHILGLARTNNPQVQNVFINIFSMRRTQDSNTQ